MSSALSLASLLVVATLAASLVVQGAPSGIDFKNPVRSAAEDEIKTLPGLNYNTGFKHYSGYLEADSSKNRFWHYWFVESRSKPDQDPLVLWLNGGPGCSSMLGLFTELGPYAVDHKGTLYNNPFAWNKNANVIFMESPAGVGFSYAADGSVVADDDSTAQQNYQAIKSFLRKFPQFKNRPLYLTGESYGGVYLPTLAVLCEADPELNLKGVAIGNGYLNANKLSESLVFFSYYHGLIGQTTWLGLSTSCCDGKPPARGMCKFTDAQRSKECSQYVYEAVDAILQSGINPYNLYDRCAQPSTVATTAAERVHRLRSQLEQLSTNRQRFDKSLLMHAFNSTSRRPDSFLSSFRSQPKGHRFDLVGGDPPCSDESLVVDYLRRDDVREAIHVPKELKQYSSCFDEIKYTMIYPDQKDGLAPQMRKLIESPRKLTLLVYNGDVDLMCNFLGDEWFVDDLGRKVIADYSPWHVNGTVAGFVKHYDGITFMTVKGSGHMVPTDKPVEALVMFETFLFGHKHQ